ncbi:MAG: acetyl-CoA carboxylase biotin carboxyl carrier protein [Verrucomicrobiales bacterium]|nr:acetyl-CoA carboxylase biotin carboxyl carrier protein [Verrucomicrobiales bacterium]
MDIDEIKKILELMDEHGLSYFQLDQDGAKLELKKGPDMESIRSFMSAAPSYTMMQAPQGYAPAPVASPAGPADSGAGTGLASDEVEIKSPMVGTFYRSSKPENPSFVEVGSVIGPDSTVCIIEAMKVFNEIAAEISGTITALLVENGTPVQFGEPLFRVRKG